MSDRRWRGLASLALATSMLANVATAQPDLEPREPSPLREAQEAYERRDFATCAKKAAQGYELTPMPLARALEGTCHAELGDWVRAANALQEAALTETDPERKARFDEKFVEARSHVATIIVETDPRGAQIALDKSAAGRSPARLFVLPGHHTLEFNLEGYEARRVEIDLSARDEAKIASHLPPAKPATPVPEDPPPPKKPVWPTAVLAGSGALGLGIGIGLQVVAAQELTPFDGEPCLELEDTDTCPANVRDAVDAHDRFAAGGLASFIIGGTLLAGMIVYVVWPEPKPKPKTPAPIVVPMAMRGGGGLGVIGRF